MSLPENTEENTYCSLSAVIAELEALRRKYGNLKFDGATSVSLLYGWEGWANGWSERETFSGLEAGYPGYNRKRIGKSRMDRNTGNTLMRPDESMMEIGETREVNDFLGTEAQP